MPNEIDIVGDLDDPHIVVHHLDGIEGDILAARIQGFSVGTEKYVSFVDPEETTKISEFAAEQNVRLVVKPLNAKKRLH